MTTFTRSLKPAVIARLLVAILLAAGVRPAIAEPAKGETPKEVRIATVAYAIGGKVGFNGAAGVIEQNGWLRPELAKRNVRLVWVPVSAQSVGATVNEAFANRSIDFAAYGDLPSIILNAGGIQTRVVVPGGRGNNVYLVVPRDSTARTLADLKGKRIALHRGRPWEITFARLVAEQGLRLSDFRIANLNPGAGAAALAAGDVDGFVTLSDAFQLVDRKVGKVIWSTKNSGQDWKMRAELWGDKAFIDSNPELTQIVANAFVKAAHWSSQPANFEAYLQIAVRSGQPENALRQEYTDDSVSWKERWSPLPAAFVVDHYRHAIAYSREARLIRSDLDAASLFDTRFVTTALKELRLDGYWSAPPAVTAKAD